MAIRSAARSSDRRRFPRYSATLIAATALMALGGGFWITQVNAKVGSLDGVKGLHYTVNHAGDFASAAEVGFNLADVSSVWALDDLGDDAKGILWMRNGYDKVCEWQRNDADTEEVLVTVRDHPHFSHIYFIADTPHPSVCPDAPQRIADRTALIKNLDPEARTFIAVSGGHKYQEEFAQLSDAADLSGVVVYPCNFKDEACKVEKITERVQRAFDAGIPHERLVPVFQAFGQSCSTNEKKFYRLPTADELKAILTLWDELLPPETRPFTMTYSWGEQERHACPSLATASGGSYPDLKNIYTNYFAGRPL